MTDWRERHDDLARRVWLSNDERIQWALSLRDRSIQRGDEHPISVRLLERGIVAIQLGSKPDQEGVKRVAVIADQHGAPEKDSERFARDLANTMSRPGALPENLSLTVYPCLNTRGYALGTRLNGDVIEPKDTFVGWEIEGAGHPEKFYMWTKDERNPELSGVNLNGAWGRVDVPEIVAVSADLRNYVDPQWALDVHSMSRTPKVETANSPIELPDIQAAVGWSASAQERASIAAELEKTPRDREAAQWIASATTSSEWHIKAAKRLAAAVAQSAPGGVTQYPRGMGTGGTFLSYCPTGFDAVPLLIELNEKYAPVKGQRWPNASRLIGPTLEAIADDTIWDINPSDADRIPPLAYTFGPRKPLSARQLRLASGNKKPYLSY
ncbi:MAG: hypothetical protein HOQ05_03990 [Corynebacteriales bacterium]|nr:hypothetical protein [Mycobacteriales bacterium]